MSALLILACVGCSAYFKGNDLPQVEVPSVEPTALTLAWDLETDRGADAPADSLFRPSPRAAFIESLFVSSGIFASVERGEGDAACHIHVIDRSWWKRNGWEMMSAIISIATLGIVPGYAKDDYELEFRVALAGKEKSYRYADHVDVWWGWWGLLFPSRSMFEIALPDGPATWGEPPAQEVLENMIRHFLVDFDHDLATWEHMQD